MAGSFGANGWYARGAAAERMVAYHPTMRKQNVEDEALKGLKPPQRAFVLAYVGESNLCAWRAAEASGHTGANRSLRAVGSRLLANASIAQAIDKILTARAMSGGEVLQRLSDHARGSIEDVIEIVPGGVDRDTWVGELVQLLRAESPDFEAIMAHLESEPTAPGWRVNLEKAEEAGVLHLIRNAGYDRDGRPQVEMYDAQAALKELGRHRGLFVDRSQVEDGGAALDMLRQFLSGSPQPPADTSNILPPPGDESPQADDGD